MPNNKNILREKINEARSSSGRNTQLSGAVLETYSRALSDTVYIEKIIKNN